MNARNTTVYFLKEQDNNFKKTATLTDLQNSGFADTLLLKEYVVSSTFDPDCHGLTPLNVSFHLNRPDIRRDREERDRGFAASGSIELGLSAAAVSLVGYIGSSRISGELLKEIRVAGSEMIYRFMDCRIKSIDFHSEQTERRGSVAVISFQAKSAMWASDETEKEWRLIAPKG